MKFKKGVSLLLTFLLLMSFITIPAAAYNYKTTINGEFHYFIKNANTGDWYEPEGSTAYENIGGDWGDRLEDIYPKVRPIMLQKAYESAPSWTWSYQIDNTLTSNGKYGCANPFSIRWSVCLYYYRHLSISYSYSGVVPNGAPSLPATFTGASTGDQINIAPTPSMPGYQFSGWAASNVDSSGSYFTVENDNIYFTGTWTPRTDTPYIVEFHRQNLADDDYTKQVADTITGKGTTDTQIRAAMDMVELNTKYPHYHLTNAAKADTTVIGGNGTSVLKLYYDLDTANVSYLYSGTIPKKAPVPPAVKAQRYGATVAVEQAPTLPGYDFSGWASKDAYISSGTFTMADKDVSITGAWEPHTDTPYVVEYYKQNLNDDGYILADTEQCTGTTDTMAVVPEKTYTGFSMTPASVTASTSTNIDGEGTTILKLYYDRNVNTVTYAYSGDTDTTPPTLPAESTYRYGQTVTLDKSNPSLQGYEFGGWEISDVKVSKGQFIMPDGPVSITGKWIPRTDTPFIVEYYQQSLSVNQYTLAYTFNGEGTTGGNVPHKEFIGFTEVPDSVATEGSTRIKSDGTARLKLYYDRNVNMVTYAYSGETDVTPPTLPTEATYRYGETVTVDTSNPTLQGYDFSGWKNSDMEVSEGQFIMPDGPVVITGKWVPRTDTPFVVEYYQQNVEDDDYALASTFSGTGTTGANIPHKEFEGFMETPDSMTVEGNAKICSDGSTALKLFYDRSSYQVAFSYSGAAPEDAPKLPAEATYRYGTEVPVPEVPGTLSGMSFSGWFTGDKRLSKKTFTVPAQDTQIIGGWNEIHDSDDDKPEQPITQPVQTLEDNGSAYIIGYDDGTFRPDDFLTAKQEALMLSRLGLSVTPISAMPENLEIACYITRREFLSALLDVSGASAPDASSPMAQAAAQGWITGYTNGELYPDSFITRAQAVTIINRAFGRTATQDVAYKISYADLPRNHWAYDAVIAASTTM